MCVRQGLSGCLANCDPRTQRVRQGIPFMVGKHVECASNDFY